METSTVEITPSAQAYLVELLSKQEDTDIAIRIFITDPGTPMAETCIAYSKLGEEQPTDLPASYDGFNAWIDERSVPFLEDALVDYAKDRMGGQLTIKAPNAKMPRVDENSPLEDRINYVLYNEVNPALAAHGDAAAPSLHAHPSQISRTGDSDAIIGRRMRQ